MRRTAPGLWLCPPPRSGTRHQAASSPHFHSTHWTDCRVSIGTCTEAQELGRIGPFPQFTATYTWRCEGATGTAQTPRRGAQGVSAPGAPWGRGLYRYATVRPINASFNASKDVAKDYLVSCCLRKLLTGLGRRPRPYGSVK